MPRTSTSNGRRSPPDESKWKDSVITVLGEVPRLERRYAESQPVKASERRHRYAVQVQMRNQTMLVTGCAPNTCSGMIVLNSDKVSPNTNPGANNIEFLLDKVER